LPLLSAFSGKWMPLLSAFSGKWMPLSVEIPCVLAIYGLASILLRKNSVFSNFSDPTLT
jgi:hypothetical protein